MSRIFLSHSSTNNAEAVALRDGWRITAGKMRFSSISIHSAAAAGEHWERALHEAASRCEAVLFLVSKAWLASVWCRKERLFGVLIEDLPVGELPEDLTGTWQIVRLALPAPTR